MQIYNTLTRKKEKLVPMEDGKIKMFVCGPTVYDYIHIGNARTFVIFDVVAKYLRYRGFDLTYIQNITDIDNKIIERAQKEGIDPLEYAKKYSEFFKVDMQALVVTSPEYKNATDHIPEVIKQVQTLLDKGHAYTIEKDGIYFDLSTFPDYGKLSGRTAAMADDAVSRIDDSSKKRNSGDFALWKFDSHTGDPFWPAPFGDGRPGWHIEDTAITDKYFGSQYDIHGGGMDLMFPHHEAEIAQQESASGLKPFVKYWMHGGFLVNKESKMSKSLGNFLTLHEALEKYSPETLRYYFLSSHYRASLDFSNELLDSARAGLENILELRRYINLVQDKDGFITGGDDKIKDYKKLILDALDDDFSTPEAFGLISGLFSQVFTKIHAKSLDQKTADSANEILELLNKVFGIVPDVESLPENIKKLVADYDQARQNKDYSTSDQLRTKIKNLGYEIGDTIYGPLIKKSKAR